MEQRTGSSSRRSLSGGCMLAGPFPQSLVGRYPRSSGSSVMLCHAILGSPGTHRIDLRKNHMSVRDAR